MRATHIPLTGAFFVFFYLLTSSAATPCADISNVVASTVNTGNICSSSAFTSGASSTIVGNIRAVEAITLGANCIVNRGLRAGAAITLGANSLATGCATAGAAITLGAYSHVSGFATSTIGVVNFGLGSSVGNSFPDYSCG